MPSCRSEPFCGLTDFFLVKRKTFVHQILLAYRERITALNTSGKSTKLTPKLVLVELYSKQYLNWSTKSNMSLVYGADLEKVISVLS